MEAAETALGSRTIASESTYAQRCKRETTNGNATFRVVWPDMIGTGRLITRVATQALYRLLAPSAVHHSSYHVLYANKSQHSRGWRYFHVGTSTSRDAAWRSVRLSPAALCAETLAAAVPLIHVAEEAQEEQGGAFLPYIASATTQRSRFRRNLIGAFSLCRKASSY